MLDMMPIFDTDEVVENSSFASALIGEMNEIRKQEEVTLPRSEVVKKMVMKELQENFLYKSERGRAAAVIAASLPATWWVKQTEKETYETIRLLYSMVEERAETARKKAERMQRLSELEAKRNEILPGSLSGRSFFGSARVTAAPAYHPRETEAAAPVITLEVSVAPAVRAVLERTAFYLQNPAVRPVSEFKPNDLKEERFLSARTKEDYKRGAVQVRRVLAEQGRKTSWDMCAYLVEVAEKFSVSTYKRQRTMVLRYASRNGEEHVADMVRALPPYAEMCKILGRVPSRRSTAVTEARRAVQNERTFSRLLSHLSPEHRDAILAIRFTGARSCEAESLHLTREGDAIRVFIKSAKTGARKKKPPTSRSWVVPISTPEGAILSGVLERRGEKVAPFSASALRAAWRRARLLEGLNNESHWDLHSLRHQYAADEKKKRAAQLRAKHGTDWRRRMYGRDWRNSVEYKDAFYGELAKRLGHTNTDMCKIYG